MIRIVEYGEISPEDILCRDITAERDVELAVDEIIADVAQNGDEALRRYAEKFDGARLESVVVSERELDAAVKSADPYFLETLEQAAQNIRAFHELQRHNDFVRTADGIVMGQRYTPIEKVGLYVPGGTASYPSTVLMNAIPAKIAGVSEIVMTTPPSSDGSINANILAAAKAAGVSKIIKAGGAQAVAALAYGTESVPKVDKIVGPGNIYVATAKRRVFGRVAIDMIAGPSEILIIADGDSDPAWVAADLLSQAEHDARSSAVLVTDSRPLAESVARELERQIETLERRDIARRSIDDNGKIIITRDIQEALEAANIVAPEHLELCVAGPFSLLDSVKNAGSVFLGRSTPEALGDYFAGPNHTLPTSGTARFSSPLSVDDFVKKSSFLCYDKAALAEAAERVADFARREGLGAHARSVLIRGEGGEGE